MVFMVFFMLNQVAVVIRIVVLMVVVMVVVVVWGVDGPGAYDGVIPPEHFVGAYGNRRADCSFDQMGIPLLLIRCALRELINRYNRPASCRYSLNTGGEGVVGHGIMVLLDREGFVHVASKSVGCSVISSMKRRQSYHVCNGQSDFDKPGQLLTILKWFAVESFDMKSRDLIFEVSIAALYDIRTRGKKNHCETPRSSKGAQLSE
jgi:hypothetical protein